MADKFLQLIEMLAAVLIRRMFKLDAINLTAVFQHIGKDAKGCIGKQVIEADNFIAKAQIRFIRTKAAHALLPWDPDEMILKIHILNTLEDSLHEFLNRLEDCLFITEGHLNIDLGEFRLTVSTQILITETSGNLEILLHTGNHQQLLENLRRLRQSPEVSLVDSGRHQIVTGTLWCRTGQNWCFHFHEAVFIQIVAGNHADLVPQHQILLQNRTAQIQIAVLQAGILIGAGIITDINRQCLSTVDDIDITGSHFHLTSCHLRIGFLAHLYFTSHLQNVLITYVLDLFTDLFIKDNLGQTAAVTQVNKHQ